MTYEELLGRIHERSAEGRVWDKENMVAHVGEYRPTRFVASEIRRGRKYEFFVDEEGEYWYTSKAV